MIYNKVQVKTSQQYIDTLHNVERDLSLTALVVGTSKISLTSLSTSDTSSFRDAFNDEIILLFLLFKLVFHQQHFSKFFFGSNLNLSRSLLKSEDIAKVHDQNLLNAMLLKAVFPLPEHFC